MKRKVEDVLIGLKKGVREARMQGLTPGGRKFLLGRWYEATNNLSAAEQAYVNSFHRSLQSNSRSAFRTTQWRQFELERLRHELGAPRVFDPLFLCEARPLDQEAAERQSVVAGSFRAEWTHVGLHLDIIVTSAGVDRLHLLLDGEILRTLVPRTQRFLPGGWLSFTIKRPSLEHFPPESELSVETADGVPLTIRGGLRAALSIPHGTGTISTLLGEHEALDKKGFLIQARGEIDRKHLIYLENYARAREAFDTLFGSPLFLMYGTLLGQVREGDFITGDDDFDVAYFSKASSTTDVKEEAKGIVRALVRAGFTISFNRSGRLFRLRRASDPPGSHLDVRPVWYQQGKIWAHKHACLPCVPADFVPVQVSKLRDQLVYVPNRPERFLRAYYGPGWRVPDPGYSHASAKIPASVPRHLDKTCITPEEFRSMSEELQRETAQAAGHGRFVSIGSHSLYPLGDYEQQCEWSG